MVLSKFLNTPYPFYESSWQSLRICLGIGIFIASFCYFFKPFGLDGISSQGQLGYGVVSFLVCSLYILFLPMIFTQSLRTKGWKIYKEILWILAITISLGIANYFYSGYVFDAGYSFHLESFVLVLTYTALVAIIPAITIILYKKVFVYKRILDDVEWYNESLPVKTSDRSTTEVIIASDGKSSEDLKINRQDLAYISSAGNYIEVFYFENGVLSKKLIRNNISRVQKALWEDWPGKYPEFFRCHRTKIVNLNLLEKVEGNLQGYQLTLKGVDKKIPVSRSYTWKFRTKWAGK